MPDQPSATAARLSDLLRVARDLVTLNDARERRAQIRHDNTKRAS